VSRETCSAASQSVFSPERSHRQDHDVRSWWNLDDSAISTDPYGSSISSASSCSFVEAIEQTRHGSLLLHSWFGYTIRLGDAIIPEQISHIQRQIPGSAVGSEEAFGYQHLSVLEVTVLAKPFPL